MARRPAGDGISDNALKGILKSLVENARPTETVADERADALDYYNQLPLGNEIDDRSQLVTSDVFDVVETVKSDLLEVFAGSDEVVAFEPKGREDEEGARQATDYCTYIYQHDNPGFEITHDVLHNALLQKTGVFKVHWVDSGEPKRHELENITIAGVDRLLNDPEVEIIEQEEKVRHVEDEMGNLVPEIVFDLTILRTPADGRVRVEVIAPEHYLKSQDFNGRDRPRVVGEERPIMVSDLVEMGYDVDRLDAIPTGNEDWTGNQANARRRTTGGWGEDDAATDRATRKIMWRELYVLMDYDGDGVAELRQINCAGPGYEIFENEEVSDDPYVDFAAIRVPHTALGKAYADLLKDIQELNTTIWRQWVDNLYLINNGRYAASTKVDLASYLDNSPASMVKVNTQMGDVAGHIVPLAPNPLGGIIAPAMEMVQTMREGRLGVTRYNQGMDAESLNKTMGGISMIMGRAQRRLMGTARIMAETGFKPMMKKILALVIERQDKPRVLRMRNKWVEMDPRSWNAEMDVSVKVGLGHGTKEQQLFMANTLLNTMKGIVMQQGGVNGPLVDLKGLYEGLKRLTEALGYRSPDAYFIDPANAPDPQPKGPDPKMQLEAAKLKADSEQAKGDLMVKVVDMLLKDERERKKTGITLESNERDSLMELGKRFADMGRAAQPQPQAQPVEGFQ